MTQSSDTSNADLSRYAELQRAGLAELLALSVDAVDPVLSRIEDEFRSTESALNENYERAMRRVQEGYEREIRDYRNEHETGSQLIGVQHDTEMSRLRMSMRVTRDQLRGELATIEQEARRSYEDEVWEADTVIRSTRRGLRQELKKMEERIAAARQHPAGIAEEFGVFLQTFRLDVPVPGQPQEIRGELQTEFDQEIAEGHRLQGQLRGLTTLRLFSGYRWVPLAAAVGAGLGGSAAIACALGWLTMGTPTLMGGLAAAAGMGTVIGLAKPLGLRGRRAAHVIAAQLQARLDRANATLQARSDLARTNFRKEEARARLARESDIRKAREVYELAMSKAIQKHESSITQIESTSSEISDRLNSRKVDQMRQLDDERSHRYPGITDAYEAEVARIESEHTAALETCTRRYESDTSTLRARWRQGLDRIQGLLEATARLNRGGMSDWQEADWRPPRTFCPIVRFGRWSIDPGRLAEPVRELAPFEVDGGSLDLPAVLSFPHRGSMLLETGSEGRNVAIDTLKSVMVRLLTSLPPGRVHFTIIDPVGLGENFAGFMHLTDYEDALVGGRIWTERGHIEQRLTDLTQHMETVIQKYLRNEFETIDSYNRQAGVLAEPYRFLVIANFPVNISDESARRLNSIVSSGARCGVHTLIAHDKRHKMPSGIVMEDVAASSVHGVYERGRFVLQDQVARRFPLILDTPPADADLTRLMQAVGEGSRTALRVEVPFDRIAPRSEEWWSAKCDRELTVPVGMCGATRRQQFSLGQGVAQHVLLAGKTGSGKSTLLHVLVTNLALWYSPDEVEFYLVDFKKGVEFKTYASHQLPHARVVAIESDREFGLSVLQRLDVELQRRGDLFRRTGVQDLAAYRAVASEVMPRTLLVVDEFQVLFAEDDRLAQDASVLLDRLVRQGRAFGIHVILGSQTLGGTSRLPRSTMGQMAVRVALQCSEADALLILDDNNTAARLLTRPGEAIYNDAGGLIEANSQFQTAWLADDERDRCLEQVTALAARSSMAETPIVFEGNVAADLRDNGALQSAISGRAPESGALPVWLGEAVAIKDPTAVTFRHQSGSNLIIVGQRDEAAMGLMTASIVALSAQCESSAARFVIMNGSPEDVTWHGDFERLTPFVSQAVEAVEWNEVPGCVDQVAKTVQARHAGEESSDQRLFVMVYGLQRYRMLRRREDDFGFAMKDDAVVAPDRLLATIVRDGPSVGVHVMMWVDTYATCERCLDRATLGEFDNRVLFQMSASDSSNLIDSPLANRLGFHRALFYSEEQGLFEKFRPYARIDVDWLAGVMS
jgi:hypothetical protein